MIIQNRMFSNTRSKSRICSDALVREERIAKSRIGSIYFYEIFGYSDGSETFYVFFVLDRRRHNEKDYSYSAGYFGFNFRL